MVMFVGAQQNYNIAVSISVLLFKAAGRCNGFSFISFLCIHLGFFVLATLAKVDICFLNKGIYKNFYPPKTLPSNDRELIYQVSLNQRMSRPIIAVLCEGGKPIDKQHTDYSHSFRPRTFMIESLDSYVAKREEGAKDPVKDKLVLCQYAAEGYSVHDPRRYDTHSIYSRKICGGKKNRRLLCIKYYKNVLMAQGLYHVLDNYASASPLRRVLRFMYTSYDNTMTHKDTEPFLVITKPAMGVRWQIPPPRKVKANSPFTIELNIVDKDGNVIRNNLDSTLFVEVTVEYTNKYFTIEPTVEGFLYKTKMTMDGSEVITSLRNMDRILRKRAENGTVRFEGIRLLDASTVVFLNATLIVPRSNVRQPDEYPDIGTNESLGCPRFVSASEVDTAVGASRLVMTFTSRCSTQYKSKAVNLSEVITVEEQEAKTLILETPEEGSYRSTVNFPVPNLWVRVVDEDNNQIHSGSDSDLFVTVTTVPGGIKLTGDSNIQMYRGQGMFLGAICEAKKVKLVFKVQPKSGETLEVTSSEYDVSNEINVAVYGHLTTKGGERDLEPSTATFAYLGVNDVNEGFDQSPYSFPNLKDKKLVLKSYDTHDDYLAAIELFEDMIAEGQKDTSKDVKAIIGFGSDEMLYKLSPFVDFYNIPVLTYSAVTEELSDILAALRFRTVKPVCWNSISVAVNLGLMLVYRKWNVVIVITCESRPVPRAIQRKLLIFHIEVVKLYIEDSKGKKVVASDLQAFWPTIKSTKTKIIFHYVPSPVQYILYMEAIKNECGPFNGYQWLTIEQPAREFPWTSTTQCKVGTKRCDEAMAGTLLISGTYNTQGQTSDTWFHVNQLYYGMDQVSFYGTPTTRRNTENGAIALGYDAVITLAFALNNLYSQTDVAMDGNLIVNEINKISFTGLSGEVEFQDNRRVGFIAELISVNKADDPFSIVASRWVLTPAPLEMYVVREHQSILQWTVDDSAIPVQHLQMNQKRSTTEELFENVDMKFWQTEVMLSDTGEKRSPPLTLPNTSQPAVRYYLSKRNVIQPKRALDLDYEVVLRTEYYTTPFNCPAGGCGTTQTNVLDYTIYDRGTCTENNECRCKYMKEVIPDTKKIWLEKAAYYNPNCENISCSSCQQGICNTPNNCTCFEGWTGENCSSPLCVKVTCVNGQCSAPDKCECDLGYHGETCNVLLGAIVLAVLLFLLIVCVLLFGYLHWRKRRKRKRDEAQNLDWLVRWKDVAENITIRDLHVISPDAGSTGSAVSQAEMQATIPESDREDDARDSREHLEDGMYGGNYGGPYPGIKGGRVGVRYVEWKDQECFVQKFDRPSVNIDDMEIRKEILQLRELRHHNLIHFIGVCVEWPHVCILVEIMPKGSLDQIIGSATFSLTWSFKYSILRDICSGMEYIHNSKLGSHGRLKSTNCLVDNRWTCKISGFGIPTMRSKSYAVYELDSMRRSMLWTAPELLRLYSNPSEIGKGTKLGDSYSFGIILTEMCCHQKPWEAELAIISLEELIRILKDIMHPANRGIKRLLETQNYDTTKPFRPAVAPTYMPEAYVERKSLKRVIDDLLNEDPIKRPTFKEITAMLHSIHPLKGELVENLIDMLEQYTNHLEDVLAGKMQEVQSEKKKTEDVIARLLPASIAEQLKHNDIVPPQKHDDVTVFFSDIKGFTAIAKASKPMQVVELLNELYTVFDSIIDSYDAYKLETIGDAYCVASGIPTPNPNHAEDVTNMALDISSAVDDFPIRHLPGRSLECRIGLNSGSVVAGVLGVKMPRYCIFGVDVVIASQMESNGECKKVHISENTAKLLIPTDKFILVYRGETDLKTVGKMKTYFVYRKRVTAARRPGSLDKAGFDSSTTSLMPDHQDVATKSAEDMKRKYSPDSFFGSGQSIERSTRFSVMGQKRRISSKEDSSLKDELIKATDVEPLPRERQFSSKRDVSKKGESKETTQNIKSFNTEQASTSKPVSKK